MTIRCSTISHIFKVNFSSHRNIFISKQLQSTSGTQQLPNLYYYLNLERTLISSYRHSSTSSYFFRKMGTPEKVANPADDTGANGEVVKTANQLKNEAKRLAKMEKLAKKQQQQQQQPKKSAANEEKAKAKKEKSTKKVITYDINTPPGDKKRYCMSLT